MPVFVVSMNIYDYSGTIIENKQKDIHKLTFNVDPKSTIRLSKLFKQKNLIFCFKYILLIFEFQSMEIESIDHFNTQYMRIG